MNFHLPKTPLLAALALVAMCVLVPTASAAKPGSVNAKIDGLPKATKAAKRVVTVRVIEATTGKIVASKKTSGATFKAKLPVGIYVFAARSFDRKGVATEARSRAFAVKAGKTAKVKAKAKRKKSKKRAARKSAFAAADPAGIFDPNVPAGRMVLGVDPKIAISGFKEYPQGLEIDSMIISDVSQKCPSGKPDFDLVEIRNRAELLKEIALGDSPYFDKKTTVQKGKLIQERQMVRGSGKVVGGRLSVQLQVVDLATGEIIAEGAAEGPEKQFAEVIADVDALLMQDLCAGKVDVKVTGSGQYQRHEYDEDMDSEHNVTANYSWEITYKNVRLRGASYAGMAATASATGTWKDDGRYGVVGPGSYSCGGPLQDPIGTYSVIGVEKHVGGYRLKAMPYMSVGIDPNAISCSGLPGPPFTTFLGWGMEPATMAIVDVTPEEVAAGGFTKAISAPEPFATDCSNLIGQTAEGICSHSLSWSGSITVTPSE